MREFDDAALERRLRGVLKTHLGQLPIDLTVEELDRRRKVRDAARRRRRGLIALGLAAAVLLPVGVLVGGGRPLLEAVVVPVPSVPPEPSAGPPSPTAVPPIDPCGHPSRAADIVDTYLVGANRPSWTSAPRGGSRVTAGGIAAVDPETGDVRYVAPDTGATCPLVELPTGFIVRALEWSSRGDALAIAGDTSGPGQLLVWSVEGISRAWVGPDSPSIAWASDGSAIAVASRDGIEIISASRGTSSSVACAECGGTARLAWSPDGARLAAGNSTPGAATISVGPVAGPLRILDARRASLALVGWSGPGALMAFDPGAQSLLSIPTDDPVAGVSDLGSIGSVDSVPVFAPRLDRLVRPDLTETSIEVLTPNGSAREIVGAAAIRGSRITAIGVSPDGLSIAFSTVDGSGAFTSWTAGIDGSGLHQVGATPLALIDTRVLGPVIGPEGWQPIWR
jgi:hypothetical protein